MSLVRSGNPLEQTLETLRARVVELESELRQRDEEITNLRVGLAAFRIEYRKRVGRLHEELDELELKLAEAELGEINKTLDAAGAAASSEPASPPPPDSAPKFTSDSVRRLFRDVARAIHPDLAEDDVTRDRRHELMVEANRAYALGDEERLRAILKAWQQSPEAVTGSDVEATRLRLERRIAQLEEQISACDTDLAELQQTPLWKLKAMVDEAAANGKDLIAEMVRRLERDIMVTRNRLDAITWRP